MVHVGRINKVGVVVGGRVWDGSGGSGVVVGKSVVVGVHVGGNWFKGVGEGVINDNATG